MKGQSILLSHAILVGFSIFLVYAVSTTFVTLKNDYQHVIGGNEVDQLCFVIRGAVDKMQPDTNYNFTADTVLGSMDINFPERIAASNYRIKFANQSAVIDSLDNKFNQTCRMTANAVYTGQTSGGLTRITYTRTPGGDLVTLERIS